MTRVADRFHIFEQNAKSILTRTSGFIADAGFSHSLTPARNCTFGCVYCYVPTMGIYGGLKKEDWTRWGQLTTLKQNAAELLRRDLRGGMRVYCSPLVDPYQPAEETACLMPGILEALMERPPLVVAIQTRGPLILRDLDLLRRLSCATTLRVSFSVTTDRDEVRRLYEPHCAPVSERLAVIGALNAAGIAAHATLAPILPCDAEALVDAVCAVSPHDIVVDPLHLREVKRHGATTRAQAYRIAERHGHLDWFDAGFQRQILAKMEGRARHYGRRLAAGPEAFSWLSQPHPPRA